MTIISTYKKVIWKENHFTLQWNKKINNQIYNLAVYKIKWKNKTIIKIRIF
jgi:hypothetical protein